MNPLYEKYFLGEMSDDERRLLEQDLAQNPDMRAQFEADRELAELLKSQMLRRKITAILAEPGIPAPQSGNKAKRWWAGLGLAGLLLLSWLVWRNFSGNDSSEPSPQSIPQQNQQEQPSVPIVEQPATTPESKETPEKVQEKQPELIVEAVVELHSLQGMRGSEGDSTPWGRLVEKIWYTPFPGDPNFFGPLFKPAATAISKGNYTDGLFLLGKLGSKPFEVYKKEQADTSWTLIDKIEKKPAPIDTLAFLRGYAMMRLWEGKPAMYNFNKLAGKPHPWQAEVEWYAGLCHLLTGEKNEATKVFKKIAAQPKHAYRKPASKALELLD